MNVSYASSDYDKMAQGILDDAFKNKINPKRHNAAMSVIEDIVDDTGSPKTFTEIDQLRQSINLDLMGSNADDAQKRFGKKIISQIDEFIEIAKPNQINGTGDEGASIKNARSLNSRFKKSERFDQMALDARLSPSGIVGEIKKLLRNPKKLRGFSDEEVRVMRSIAEGKDVNKALTLLSKTSGDGTRLIARRRMSMNYAEH